MTDSTRTGLTYGAIVLGIYMLSHLGQWFSKSAEAPRTSVLDYVNTTPTYPTSTPPAPTQQPDPTYTTQPPTYPTPDVTTSMNNLIETNNRILKEDADREAKRQRENAARVQAEQIEVERERQRVLKEAIENSAARTERNRNY